MPRNKDPEKPKGRSSAYAFFVAKERREKRQRNEQVEFIDFSQSCSSKWKDMDEDDKKPFSELAAQDKARYEEEMAHYVPPAGAKGGGKRQKRRGKKDKDPNLPKRGKSAFIMFCGEHRRAVKEKNPRATIGEIAKELGSRWGTMDEDDKKPFEELAAQDRDRYRREMEEYRKKGAAGACGGDDDDEEEEEESDE